MAIFLSVQDEHTDTGVFTQQLLDFVYLQSFSFKSQFNSSHTCKIHTNPSPPLNIRPKLVREGKDSISPNSRKQEEKLEFLPCVAEILLDWCPRLKKF